MQVWPHATAAIVFVQISSPSEGDVGRNAESGRRPADGENIFQHLNVPERGLHEDLRLATAGPSLQAR
ncbi:MAG: hypothetical protein MZV63_11515 [Marinilabiliales bacterium]|nr:hypothetical protein [Marinilabiliales bacterium]